MAGNTRTRAPKVAEITSAVEGIEYVKELFGDIPLSDTDAYNLYIVWAGCLVGNASSQRIVDQIQARLYAALSTGSEEMLPSREQIRTLSLVTATNRRDGSTFDGMAFNSAPAERHVDWVLRHADFVGRNDESGEVKMPKTRAGFYRLVYRHRETFGTGKDSTCAVCIKTWAERAVDQAKDKAAFEAAVEAGKAAVRFG